MEKTVYPQPRLKFILNKIKNVHVPRKPQRDSVSEVSALTTLLFETVTSETWLKFRDETETLS